MRSVVVLGEGRYANELNGHLAEDGPRHEFVEIAKSLNADVISYTSAAAVRGRPFTTLFSRYKKVGSALNAAMLAQDYDRIYVTAEGVGLPLAILLKSRQWKGKIACVFHNVSWPSKKHVIKLLGHEIFAALITVNQRQADILKNDCGIPVQKVLPVHNWVDERFFLPKTRSPDMHEPFVMACGAENRDYETLARAAQRTNMKFVVYGHGFVAANRRAKNNVANLKYMPRVSYPDLRDAYSACSIVVVPLNDVDYAAGVTGIVEGMAAGRPIVVTASRGIKEYISEFDADTVVEAGDDEGLANAITRLKDDPTRMQDIGNRNRLYVEKRCSLDDYVLLIKERLSIS